MNKIAHNSTTLLSSIFGVFGGALFTTSIIYFSNPYISMLLQGIGAFALLPISTKAAIAILKRVN